ncbi:helix-turn-helix domain-containing protein [Streptomyces sp. NPDC086787]|uniref:helix-turn-helix domain-containing protein n=1 Tax=Streptomyces sp. NPDC086787 TaxID=3365759 RepID=UPI0038154FC5
MTAKTPPPESPKPSGWGPVSRYVAANVLRFRTDRGLSTTRLAAALKELGHSIPATGITRIEKGERRVDTDDLVALGLALNVSPAALLLPPTEDSETPVQLTGQVDLPARKAWAWVDGDEPHAPTDRDRYGQVLRFRLDSRPEWDRDPIRKMYNAVLKETSDRNALASQSGTFSMENGQLVLRSDDGREVQRLGPAKEG